MMEQLGQQVSLNTGIQQELYLAGAGTQTAALAFGGYITPAEYRSNRRI
jgi:hypothetical protein